MKIKKYRTVKRRTNIMPLIISVSSRDLDIELYNLHRELKRGNITDNEYMSEFTKINNRYRKLRVV